MKKKLDKHLCSTDTSRFINRTYCVNGISSGTFICRSFCFDDIIIIKINSILQDPIYQGAMLNKVQTFSHERRQMSRGEERKWMN